MAKLNTYHYSRKISGGDNILPIIKHCILLTSTLQVKWSNEYVYFKKINKTTLTPTSGSFHLIGNYRDHPVKVKDYSLQGFCQMIKETNATELVLILEGILSLTEKEFIGNNFNEVKVSFIYDYSKMVTDLEKIGYITTQQSKSFICNDNRQFALTNKVNKISGFAMKNYIGNLYEVDSLGSSFWKKLSEGVKDLWKYTQNE